MYEPQFWIDPAVYPLLVRWCLSTGYEIKTNEPHTILYRIACFDGIRARELREEGKDTSLSREEAETLVNDLTPFIGNREKFYDPDYSPVIRPKDDFSVHKFMPAVQRDHEVKWEQWGIYHNIEKVKVICEAKGTEKPGQLYIGSVMDRNDVLALIRNLEYESVMTPFAITYNLLKHEGGTAIMWVNPKVENLSAARALLRKEKGRHVLRDWRIYEDVTPIARKEEFLPTDYVRCEGWLWLRVYHKGDHKGADYSEEGFYEDLGKLKNDVIQIREFDMYAIWAIYACVYHEPLPQEEEPQEEEEAPVIAENRLDLMKERLGLLEAIHGALKEDVEGNLEALDRVLKPQTAPETAARFYVGDPWVRGCRSGMAIALDVLTAQIERVEINGELTNHPVRITYYDSTVLAEGVESRHVLDETIISEAEEEDHETGKSQ